MNYVIGLCGFFIIFPILLAIFRNAGKFLAGPRSDSAYDLQMYADFQKKVLIETSIEIIVIILVILFILKVLFI